MSSTLKKCKYRNERLTEAECRACVGLGGYCTATNWDSCRAENWDKKKIIRKVVED
jgi:hypothetical protein